MICEECGAHLNEQDGMTHFLGCALDGVEAPAIADYWRVWDEQQQQQGVEE